MKRLLPWIIAAALLLAFVLFIASQGDRMGAGSRRYARQWRKQLLACHSLDEVKQHFDCFVIDSSGRGGTWVAVTKKSAAKCQRGVQDSKRGRL